MRDGRSSTVLRRIFEWTVTRARLAAADYQPVTPAGPCLPRVRSPQLRSRFSMNPRAENQSLAALVNRKAEMTIRNTRLSTTADFIGEI